MGDNPEVGETNEDSLDFATGDTFERILSVGELVVSRSMLPAKPESFSPGEEVVDVVPALSETEWVIGVG